MALHPALSKYVRIISETRMLTVEKETLRRATERLGEVLGENFVSVIAFGSRVSGDFYGESDFDVIERVVRKEKRKHFLVQKDLSRL